MWVITSAKASTSWASPIQALANATKTEYGYIPGLPPGFPPSLLSPYSPNLRGVGDSAYGSMATVGRPGIAIGFRRLSGGFGVVTAEDQAQTTISGYAPNAGQAGTPPPYNPVGAASVPVNPRTDPRWQYCYEYARQLLQSGQYGEVPYTQVDGWAKEAADFWILEATQVQGKALPGDAQTRPDVQRARQQANAQNAAQNVPGVGWIYPDLDPSKPIGSPANPILSPTRGASAF